MKTINSLRSKLLALTLAITASVASFAYDYHGDLLCYNILTDSTVAVIGQSEYKTMPRYEYLPENLIIPAEVTLQGKTYRVVSIDQWAFYACSMLKSVIIPHTVTFIGMSAFQYCENLVDVYIPYSVTTVEGSAFSYTKWYDNLPDGEVYINNTLYRYKGTAPENTQIVVKDGTTRIAGFTFWNQSNIISIELPQTLTVIEHDAFEGCTQLSSILIPKNVTDIGASAFADCTGLTEVICLAPTPPTMGQYANPSANSEIFARVDVSNATLNVRSESVEAYKNADQWKEFGQIRPLPQTPEDLFPTLWGLQRTTFYHYTECSDSNSSLTASSEIVTINDKPYLRFGGLYLREANNQVLIYSAVYDKDLVLYDWNLEVGDSISLLAMDYGVYPEYAVSVVDYRVIVDIDENGDLIMDTIPTDKVVVDKISTITLLDGKEYKTWHLATEWAGGITYVEGIGILSEGYGGGDYLGLIRPEELPTCYYGDLLVCVSKNNKLLYQMDPVKMDELGAECLCDYDRGPRKDNAKNGKIGGRPTPTQWNMLEMVIKDDQQIMRAETFSYTLENDSIVANNKTYYQLARQSTKDTAITKSFVGALHFGENEDNRVYFYHDGAEYVLYDFTAEPGDTLQLFAGINNYPQYTTYTHVVTGKDTIDNGACRMILEVVFPEENAPIENAQKVWLAGLGSIDGIVHNAAIQASASHVAPRGNASSSETQTSVMLCAWREDSCLYTTNLPDYDTLGCVYNQDPTAVESTTTPSSYQKILHEGKLLILHNGKIYNVMGVEIK